MNEGYAKLRFFRDLTEGQRMEILGALCTTESNGDFIPEPMPQWGQKLLLEWLAKRGQLDKIVEMTEGFLAGEQK